jgi:hypothetical protein
VPVEIDMRAQIDAGPFDPAHDAVGVRGSLPPGYAQRAGHLDPVRYLHDGLNDFDAAAAGAERQLTETWVSMGALDDANALPEACRPHEVLRARSWTDTTLAYVETPDGHDEAN